VFQTETRVVADEYNMYVALCISSTWCMQYAV
jgi:hypothetical protein